MESSRPKIPDLDIACMCPYGKGRPTHRGGTRPQVLQEMYDCLLAVFEEPARPESSADGGQRCQGQRTEDFYML